jgi:hypothetical protein
VGELCFTRAAPAVWRSVRANGETKNSPVPARALGLPAFATDALTRLQQREGKTTGAVFATRDVREIDATNVSREALRDTFGVAVQRCEGPGRPAVKVPHPGAVCGSNHRRPDSPCT